MPGFPVLSLPKNFQDLDKISLIFRGLKRTASILLLSLLLFNWVGYRLYTTWMMASADQKLESTLDADNYNESGLITLKVPANGLPYYTNSKNFERADGQVEVDHITYKFVKRRLYNDTFELKCIPNSEGMMLQSASNEFFKIVNDLAQNNTGKKPAHSIKIFSPDQYVTPFRFSISVPEVCQVISPSVISAEIPSVCLLVNTQPPDQLA